MSLAMKYAMKKKMAKSCPDCAAGECMAHGGKVKGVHDQDPSGEPGKSVAGHYAREGKYFADSNRGRVAQSASKAHYDEAKELHKEKLADLKGMKKPHLYADGGDVDDSNPKKIQKSMRDAFSYAEGGDADGDDDLVMKIMKKRYSKGGMVANDTPPIADEEDADYDVLATDDDLEMHETGANSGDEDGDAAEDEDRKDIVSKIMKSRKKKDKMPRPA